jgi:hypothetical protein
MSFVITPLSIYLDESHFPKQDVSSKSFHYNIEDGSYTWFLHNGSSTSYLQTTNSTQEILL